MVSYIRCIVCTILLLNYYLLEAQDNSVSKTGKDYQYLQKTLNKETDKVAKDSAGVKILHPASLPSWMTEIPQSEMGVSYALGISDPGMDEKSAQQLAELRARSVIALLRQPLITTVIDNFANEQSSARTDGYVTKYETLYKVDASLKASSGNFEMISQYFTSFGECITLMKFSSIEDGAETGDSVYAGISTYQVERQKQNKSEIENRFEMEVSSTYTPDSIRLFNYSYKSMNDLAEIESRFADQKLNFPYSSFRYQGSLDSLDTGSEMNLAYKLNYGLWKAYISTLVQKMTLLSHTLSGVIKQVGDDYESQNTNLSREISEASLSFRINQINIVNNCLIIDMDYLNKPN
jgi:hypothetical protein